jgi:hypothetical protein
VTWLNRPSLTLAAAALVLGANSAAAQPAEGAKEGAKNALLAPISGRETFLALVIAAMMLCGLASFVLAGRFSERTQTALAMFVVLIGGFGLLVLFGGLIHDHPIAAVVVVALLIGLFKLMNQFEAGRKGGRKPGQRD